MDLIQYYNYTKPSYISLIPIIILQSLPVSFLEPVMPMIEVSFWSGYNDCSDYYKWNDACKEGSKRAVYASSTTTVAAALGFISSPIIGRLSDTYGRKKFLLFSQFLTLLPFLSLVCYNFIGTSLYYYYIFYGIAGIGNAGVIMLAYVADTSETNYRSLFFGRLEGVYAIVSIFSPLLNFFLPASTLISLSFAVLFASFLYTFLIPESLPESNRREFSLVGSNPFRNLYLVFSSTLFLLIAIITLLQAFAGSGITDIQYLYQYTKYQLSSAQIALTLSLFGVGSLFSNVILLPIFLKCISIFDVLKIGLGLQLTGYILLSLSSGSFIFPYIASVLNGLSVLSYTALSSIVSLNTNQQGLLQGALDSISDLADNLGSLCFGRIYANLYSPEYIFIIASSIITLALFFSFWLKSSSSINSLELEEITNTYALQENFEGESQTDFKLLPS